MKQPLFIQSAVASLRTVLRRKPPKDPTQFRALFDKFRGVLDSNNRALETITDMGEKLGGDYLFDIVYVRSAYARLKENIDASLVLFNELTNGRYPALGARLREIDGRIRHVIDETAAVPDALVVAYDRITPDMARSVGGKNSNLAEARNAAGMNVPESFAVTTAAFDLFLRHNRIFEKVSLPGSGPAPESTLHELREQVLHGAVPPELSRAIEKTVRKIRSRCGQGCRLAVRSSASEEDSDFSFAGQFETVLNVPLDPAAVEKAYRRVAASLYTDQAAAYQQRLGYEIRDMKMAAACVVMVDAEASGVAYSTDPEQDRDDVVINAAWGLGTAVVEGSVDADLFRLTRESPHTVVESRVGEKSDVVAPLKEGGVATAPAPEGKKGRPSITPEQAAELARAAMQLEKPFRKPQDIEWAFDKSGKLFILQSRPLRVSRDDARASAATPADAKALVRNIGTVVQKGAASGTVFMISNDRDLVSVPKNAVLVARRDSSYFVRVMTDVSAIITETGTPTSHMAALCREFRIPTVVNAGHAARSLPKGQEVTVVADGSGGTVYEGRVAGILEAARDDSSRMEAVAEFRKKRYLLRYIVPLNLVDPLRDEFTAKACRTLHDVLRFIHEKAVAELVDGAGRGARTGAVKLNLSVPADLLVIDIGSGLENPGGAQEVTAEQIASIPFRAIVSGMTRPGLWRSDAVPLRVNDFMTSMLRVPDITTGPGSRVERNLAVISREYANVSLKFGYHFIVMDCYCGEKARNNHIYFRFAGGATDMTKRSRRLQLLAAILSEYGFTIRTKGDLIVARLANIEQRDAVGVLEQLGRLFSYTRQLDAVLNDDAAVERYARSFLEGRYELAETGSSANR